MQIKRKLVDTVTAGRDAVIISILSLLTILLLSLFLNREVFRGYPYNEMFPGTLVLFVFLALIVVYALRGPFPDKNRNLIAVHLLSVFLTTLLIFLFRDTVYGLNGISGDAGFNSAMVTKFSYYWKNTDFDYDRLPAFYPPLYHYVLGKIALIFSIPPYKMIKYGFIAAAYLLPLVSYGLWKRIVGRHAAVLFTFVFFLSVETLLLYKTYEFTGLMLFVPWWLLYVEGITADGETVKKDSSFYFKGGVLGAVIFMTYYYYFFAGILFLGLNLAASAVFKEKMKDIFVSYKERFTVLIAAAVFSSPYWLSLLYSMVKHGSEPLQNRWFELHMLRFPVLSRLDIVSVLQLVGIIALVILAGKHKGPRTVLLILISAYLWHFIGHLGILADMPLLHMKINYLIEFIMLAGAAFAISHLKRSYPGYKRFIDTAAVVLILVVFLGEGSAYSGFTRSSTYKMAFKAKPPVELSDTAAVSKYFGKVFLTDKYNMNRYIPIYYFISMNAHHAHPASRYHERIKFLSLTGHSADPAFVAWMLTYNKFGKVDYLWMNKNEIWTSDDNFPEKKPSRRITLPFNASVKGSSFFKKDPFASKLFLVGPVDVGAAVNFDTAQLLVARYFASKEVISSIDTFLSNRLGDRDRESFTREADAYLGVKRIDDHTPWSAQFYSSFTR